MPYRHNAAPKTPEAPEVPLPKPRIRWSVVAARTALALLWVLPNVLGIGSVLWWGVDPAFLDSADILGGYALFKIANNPVRDDRRVLEAAKARLREHDRMLIEHVQEACWAAAVREHPGSGFGWDKPIRNLSFDVHTSREDVEALRTVEEAREPIEVELPETPDQFKLFRSPP